VIDKTKYKYPYLLRNTVIDRPNQVWEIDISYIPMRYGFMYLFAIIDVHSRFIVGWDISNTLDAAWVVKTIQTAVKNHGKPEIINSDQGTQFTSDEYISYIKSLQTVSISMDGIRILLFIHFNEHSQDFLSRTGNTCSWTKNRCNTGVK
jgi:putative transposase